MDCPLIDRPVTVQLMGDWGFANLHRACGWVGSQVVARCGPGSRFAIWNGTGWGQNVRAVASGTVDVAFVTPALLARLAVDGRGPFQGQREPRLRALGVVPHFDRLLFAVRRDVGVKTFADLRARRPPLRISIPDMDTGDVVAYAARHLLDAEGMSEPELESWGGRYLSFRGLPSYASEHTSPFAHVGRVRAGEADAVIFEAMTVPTWREAAVDPGLEFLAPAPDSLARIEAATGWPRATVPASFFPGQAEAFETLDFEGYLLICRDDLPADLAHLIAWCMGETREILERQYRHLPPELSPVTCPLDPVAMGQVPIQLHPGAARYFDSLSV